MSSMELNKGRLTPIDVDTEHFTEDDYDTYLENGFAVIGGEVYEVEWEIEREEDEIGFAFVDVNEDGTIDFFTHHYNGAGHWIELVEEKI